MPTIRIAKPMRINPTSRFFPRLTNIRRQIAITAMMGTQVSGLRSWTMPSALSALSDSIPERPVSHAVTAVPTFAPIITPTDWSSVIVPELTKPTTITVVADED